MGARLGARGKGLMRKSHVLLLALGNDLLGDDGVGLLAARSLKEEFNGEIDVIETSEAGLALMEMMEGYRRALLLDAVMTGRCPAGTVLEFTPSDFQKVIAPSPHYAGIPEVLDLAKRLEISFPEDLRILALEVEEPYEFSEELTPSVEKALPALIDKAREILTEWKGL